MSAPQAYFTLVFDGPPKAGWRDRLDQTLPMTPFSWNPELLIWGNRDSTSLEIWMEKEGPSHGQLRLDLRALDFVFLENVLAFTRDYWVAIEDEQGAWLPSTIDGIRLGLQRSAAWKSVTNPNDLLGQLGITHA